MTDKTAKPGELLGRFPEINFNNYGQQEVEALQAWALEAFDALSATLSPAHIEDEREACERWIRQRGLPAHIPMDWDIPFNRYTWAAWSARAALSAPPAAGVADALDQAKRHLSNAIEDVEDGKAAAALPALREVAHYLTQAAAPTPPASEQQRAVVMPEGLREALGKAASSWLYQNDPQGLDWCDPRNVDSLLDALFEAAPHLAKGEGGASDGP